MLTREFPIEKKPTPSQRGRAGSLFCLEKVIERKPQRLFLNLEGGKPLRGKEKGGRKGDSLFHNGKIESLAYLLGTSLRELFKKEGCKYSNLDAKNIGGDARS